VRRPHPARAGEDIIKFIGVQCCLTIAEQRRSEIRRLFVSAEQTETFGRLLAWCNKRDIPTKIVEYEELARIAGTERHEGVCIEAKSVRILKPAEFVGRVADIQRGVVVLLQGVENPHNVGAILRTCCFFGVTGVVVQSEVMTTLSGAACRIAEGAAEHVQISIVRDARDVVEYLKEASFSVVATTPHEARSLYAVTWPDRVVIVFGAEGSGVSEEMLALADSKVAVPRLGPIESLNVATCVGSVLTEARRSAVVKGLVRRFST
jgi:TrmH RNA methyltransferase